MELVERGVILLQKQEGLNNSWNQWLCNHNVLDNFLKLKTLSSWEKKEKKSITLYLVHKFTIVYVRLKLLKKKSHCANDSNANESDNIAGNMLMNELRINFIYNIV